MEFGRPFSSICSHCNTRAKFYALQDCFHALCKFCWIGIKADLAKSPGLEVKCPKDDTRLPMVKLGILTDADFHTFPAVRLARGRDNSELMTKKVVLNF